MKLKVNNDLKTIIPSLSKEEYVGLEKSILAEGCRDAIVVWNDIIVDGHNRYEICQRHNVAFNTVEKEFDSFSEAKMWMITNQLGRRNLTTEQRNYLIGKQYQERKLNVGGNRGNQYTGGKVACPQNEDLAKTAEILADEHKIGRATVERAAKFAEAVDTIGGNVGEDLQQQILSREIPITAKDIHKIAKMEPETQKIIVDKIKTKEAKSFVDARRILRKEEQKDVADSVETIVTTDKQPHKVKQGQWWQLGNHRLYCGDTSQKEFISELPHASFTFADPPYNAGVRDWDYNFVWNHDWLTDKSDISKYFLHNKRLFEF